VANRLLEYLPEGRISDLLVLPLLGRAEPWQPKVVQALEPKSAAGRTQTVWLLEQARASRRGLLERVDAQSCRRETYSSTSSRSLGDGWFASAPHLNPAG